MKLPNGFGSVSQLSGNRRRPWIARKTIGYGENGKPIQIAIGYFASYVEGIVALEKYNRQDSVLTPAISLHQLYKAWIPRQRTKVGDAVYTHVRLPQLRKTLRLLT